MKWLGFLARRRPAGCLCGSDRWTLDNAAGIARCARCGRAYMGGRR